MKDYTFDLDNQEMCNAYSLIAKTNKSFFLTGHAGTGKTTFLKWVQQEVKKNFVVLAPTGVAAYQAGGQTIHSFFGFSFGVQGPMDMGQMSPNKIALVQCLDTIIIDEVSMVRCDYIDAIDRMLRKHRHSSRPFGGIQMVFVGDMFQLLPIAQKDEEEMLRRIYEKNSFLFFYARCLEGNDLPKIELKKIYRQSDPAFIQLLEHFRNGEVSERELDTINDRLITPFDKKDEDMRITLTCYKNDAQLINQQRLADLTGESFEYKAIYSGNVSKLKDIVDDNLILKEGAQVMFLRNDSNGHWVNGTIGKVTHLNESFVMVQIGSDDNPPQLVELQRWEAYDYQYDEKEKKCKKEVVGSVTQYPLRLAWAITIHKSQSLTFDKVDIDFGRGAFTYGQAYVALSRARSLSGLRLKVPIDSSSVRVSRDVLTFAASYNDEEVIADELAAGEAVLEFDQKHDYDGAALKLFSMCNDAAHLGKDRYACKLLDQALSYLADDECLFGQHWEPLPNTSRDNIVLNAAGLLYSGNTDESLQQLIRVVKADGGYFNGLYMLARALELKENWETLKTLYKQMIDIFEEASGNGLDSPAFRKFKFRLALLNEEHYGETGYDIMAKLIAENPDYDKYHAALRRMLHKRLDQLILEPDENKEIVNALLDPNVTEVGFMKQLRAARSEKNDAWRIYRTWVSRLRVKKNQKDE